MSIEFHQKWSCLGECSLSDSTYESELYDVVETVANQTKHRYGPIERAPYRYNILHRFSLPPGQRLGLVDPELHGNFWIEPRSEETLEDCREKIFAVIKEMTNQANVSFRPLFEILLWLTVNMGDIEEFSAIITQHREIIPECVMSSLLSKSIHMAWVEAVELLLEKGASPEHNNTRGPLNDTYLAFMRITNSEVPNDIAKRAYERLTVIMQMLIDKGAPLLFGDHRIICNQRLHWISNLALIAPEAVRVLLRNMPIEAIRIPRALIFHGSDYTAEEQAAEYVEAHDHGGPLTSTCSALASTLFRAAQSFCDSSHSGRSKLDCVKILIDGTLPLLRSGAVCDPDPLERSRVNSKLIKLISQGSDLSLQFWGRPDAIMDILVEIRQKNKLSVPKMEHTFNSFMSEVAPTSSDAIHLGEFYNAMRHKHPRSLQSICRSVILQKLPRGFVPRRSAIDKLDFPICLKNFLNFSDLDIGNREVLLDSRQL